MPRLDDAARLCTEVDHVIDQLTHREAILHGTVEASTELIHRIDKLRRDNERFFRLKAQALEP